MSDSKVFAFLGVLLTVIGFVIALLTKKRDKYVMFYAKEGLVLFFALVAVWVINLVFFIFPPLGMIAGLAWLILWVLAMVNSLSGKMKPTPLIGKFAKKLKF